MISYIANGPNFAECSATGGIEDVGVVFYAGDRCPEEFGLPGERNIWPEGNVWIHRSTSLGLFVVTKRFFLFFLKVRTAVAYHLDPSKRAKFW